MAMNPGKERVWENVGKGFLTDAPRQSVQGMVLGAGGKWESKGMKVRGGLEYKEQEFSLLRPVI